MPRSAGRSLGYSLTQSGLKAKGMRGESGRAPAQRCCRTAKQRLARQAGDFGGVDGWFEAGESGRGLTPMNADLKVSGSGRGAGKSGGDEENIRVDLAALHCGSELIVGQ